MGSMLGFPRSTPDKEGIPSSAIIAFINALQAKGIPMHGLLMIYNGKIITEGYWKPFDGNFLHRIYSCSKSFVSLAIGFLEAEGEIALSDKLVDHFPEKVPAEGVHPYIEQTTIRDLLMMASPHEKTTYKLMDLEDWVQSFFIYPPSHIPGTVFSYDTSATHVLGALVERKAGMPFLDYLRPRLLDDLGISTQTRCLKDPCGISCGGSGVLCTLKDFALVALTCMHGGEHNGKQLIPKDYLRRATSPQISTFVDDCHMQPEYGYGYQFWCLPHRSFAFLGMGGQVALCIPDKDFLLATNADTQIMSGGESVIYEAFWDIIYPHLCEPETMQKSLTNLLSNLSLHTVQGEDMSITMPTVNGKEYRMDPNTLMWERISFTFTHNEGVLRFSKASKQHSLRFGLQRNLPDTFPETNYHCLTSAAWWNASTLNIACYIIDDHFAPVHITANFKDDSLTLHLRNGAELFIEDYNGFASGYALEGH